MLRGRSWKRYDKQSVKLPNTLRNLILCSVGKCHKVLSKPQFDNGIHLPSNVCTEPYVKLYHSLKRIYFQCSRHSLSTECTVPLSINLPARYNNSNVQQLHTREHHTSTRSTDDTGAHADHMQGLPIALRRVGILQLSSRSSHTPSMPT